MKDANTSNKQELISDAMIQTALQLRTGKAKLPPDDVEDLFGDYVNTLSPQSSMRTALLGAVFFGADKSISDELLEKFKKRLEDVLTNSRLLRRPETATQNDVLPDKENKKIEILPLSKDRTLAEVSDLLAPGQEKRFVTENFSREVLEYLFDTTSNPGEYASGFIAKTIFNATTKILNNERTAQALLGATNFSWIDDGLASNASFDAYLTKKNKKPKKSGFLA